MLISFRMDISIVMKGRGLFFRVRPKKRITIKNIMLIQKLQFTLFKALGVLWFTTVG
jgi:hypothetical protein